MFRRLAREAVIFSLLGMVLAAVGSFAYMHYSQAKSIQSERAKLQSDCSGLTAAGVDWVEAVSNGYTTTRAECNLAFGTSLVSITPDNPETLPADFFRKRDAALDEGARIKNLKIDDQSNALVAAIVGLCGFVGGFVIWGFYRLVRFAVEG
jgi:hypothetical protein